MAQRCLYGVDKNPFAVNLARLSLWLVTLAKDLPFTFLDHALKCGDSLVGLTRAEISSFGASAAYEPELFEAHKQLMKQSATKALVFRQQIQTSDTRTDRDAESKQALLQDVERSLEPSRLAAKLAVVSSFAGGNSKQRQQKREEYGGKLIGYEKGLVDETEIQSIVASLTTGSKVVLPFNWELEFPEVFERENPGFDAIVGNPPFVGGYKISSNYGDEYLSWLKESYPESGGQADLVAYFFRRSFSLLRDQGTLGLIATNTIAQGDTRKAGLRFICQNNGAIYNAQTRVRWPGLAAVIVNVIHIAKGNNTIINFLNRKAISHISAFLFPNDKHDNPKELLANCSKSFKGTMVYGMGFTFDDTNSEATSISEMYRLIDKDPRNSECIFPYIGGEEVNRSPTHIHHRYVINFGEMNEAEARQYPDLIAIVEEKVKPSRFKQNREIRARYWWRFGETTPALFKAIAKCNRVLVIPEVTANFAFAFLPVPCVFAHTLKIIAAEDYATFSTLQSSVHEIWARFFGSSLGSTLRYTPSDCFETFPFPTNWETNSNLESVGKIYYEFRADLMIRHNEGLTATYNRFHDPDETNPDILQLRQLHAQVDRAVLDAYGWTDIPTNCEFLLDYEEDEGESTNKRKKPWRYRWPEEIHDEVLARLLKLNQERAEAEKLGRTPRRKVINQTSKVKDITVSSYEELPLFTKEEIM